MTGRALAVLRTGPLALVQDTGRVGRAADGVGRAGAADRAAHALANAAVGNGRDHATIEVTLGGLLVRAVGRLFVALTGAPAPADIDGAAVAFGRPAALPDGSTLRLRTPASGLRSYLAVAGGIAVPPVLGSRSTDTLSGLGPAPLAPGDRLPVGPSAEAAGGPAVPAVPDGSARGTRPVMLRASLGPRDDWFANAADLAAGEWSVSPDSNRVGLRLDRPDPAGSVGGPPVHRAHPAELPSEGLVLGAIQVPPIGQPVLFLADHPITGGYPVVAVVVDADIDRAAQLRPGERIRFVLIA